jgi:hypothetical protein
MRKQYIILHGTLKSGFSAYGPMTRKQAEAELGCCVTTRDGDTILYEMIKLDDIKD